MICAPPALMDHRDDFNRTDSASDIGTAWRPELNFLKLNSNRVQLRTPAANTGRQGGWETYIGGPYNGGRMLTDNWRIEGQLIAPVGAAASDNGTSIGAGMQDAGPGAGMVLVYFFVSTGGNSAILTYTGSAIAAPGAGSTQAGQTVRSAIGGNVPATALIALERRMYSATQSVFTAFVNGSPTVSWDDTGGIVPAGDRSRRRWFIQCEGNFPFLQQAFYSPALDAVRAVDLKQ